jgi:broad-specificity NMP kinase
VSNVKTRKLIAVGGQPGTGKTTLFRKFMEGKNWKNVEPAKLVSAMYNEEMDLYILGKYQEGETFAGTDRLGMSCQPSVEQWITSNNSNILFEGDRLTNSKFYNFLINLPNSEVNFIIMHAKKDTLTQRYTDRGSDQSETFLKGRETKISNILTNFEFMPYVNEFTNENLEEQAIIINHIDHFLNDKN